MPKSTKTIRAEELRLSAQATPDEFGNRAERRAAKKTGQRLAAPSRAYGHDTTTPPAV